MVKRETKSLGRDPFEDMEGLDWDEAESTVDKAGVDEAVFDEIAADKATVDETATETKVVESESVPSTGSGHSPNPAGGPALAQAETQPETEPVETAAQIEPATEAKESVAAEPAGEPRPVPPVDEGEVVAQPDEEASNFLDELIATIDKEVEQAFGREAMADLAATSPVRAGGEEQHVIFALAGTEYAVPIANVTEIGQPLDVTPVPNAPDWVLGVTNLRGDIVSVVDMRAFLGMERIGYGQASRMLVAQARQEDMATSLIVDRVSGIRYLSVDRISAPTAVIEDQVAPYLRGVYEHDGPLLVVLDFDKLLLSPEMQQFRPM